MVLHTYKYTNVDTIVSYFEFVGTGALQVTC